MKYLDESIGGHPISGIFNDMDNGTWLLPDFYYEENGNEYLIGIQYPYQIIARAKSNEYKNSTSQFPEKKLDFERLAANLDETDNPALGMVKLK